MSADVCVYGMYQMCIRDRAGLTGYAQIYGKYNTTPLDKLKLDLKMCIRDRFQTVQKMNGVKTGKAGFQWAVGDAFMNNIASITDTEKFPAGVDLPCFRPRSAKKALSLIKMCIRDRYYPE